MNDIADRTFKPEKKYYTLKLLITAPIYTSDAKMLYVWENMMSENKRLYDDNYVCLLYEYNLIE